jgi:hypothetical protein
MSRFGTIGVQYFTDDNEPLSGGKLFFYLPGTTTDKPTFADVELTIPNTQPVVLDAAGRQPNIFFDGSAKAVLTDADGAVIETRDPVGDTGISEFETWDAETTYSQYQVVTGSDGLFYVSLINGNFANDPTLSPTDWKLLTQFIGFESANNGYVWTVDNTEPQKVKAVDPRTLNVKNFVASATASTTAAIDFNNLDLTLYNYIVVFENIVNSSASSALWLRTSTDNGSTFESGASDYYNGYVYGSAALGSAGGGSLSSAIILSGSTILGNEAGTGTSGEVFFTKANSSSKPMAKSLITALESASTNLVTIAAGGARNNNAAINAIRLLPSSGTFLTGNIRLYRESKS